MGKLALGLDLGGTKIAAVVMTTDGEIVGRGRKRTILADDPEQTAQRLRRTAEKALAEAKAGWPEVGSVGIAVPSPVEPATGEMLNAPNLRWEGVQARKLFAAAFEREVFLENDGNCGTLAEQQFGAMKGLPNVVGFFVGTGLGGGIILGGRLHRGLHGLAGELGHMVVAVGGHPCSCGNCGCAEAYCSKVAFGRQFRRLIQRRGRPSSLTQEVGDELDNVRSRLLAKAYEAGDEVVCTVLNEGAAMLGVAVANLMAALAPDGIVLGGGVMQALGKELLPFVRGGMARNLFALDPKDVNLKLSRLGDDAVPAGAAHVGRRRGAV